MKVGRWYWVKNVTCYVVEFGKMGPPLEQVCRRVDSQRRSRWRDHVYVGRMRTSVYSWVSENGVS
jgi:hypothetical protein